MASNTYKTNSFRPKDSKEKAKKKKTSFNFSFAALKDKKIGLSLGILLMMIGLFLFFAFLGYLFSGPADQSVISADPDVPLRQNAAEARNWLGFAGAYVSYFLIFRWFGIAAFLIPPFLFIMGFRWAFKKTLVPLVQYSAFGVFFIFWLGLLLGYIVHIVDGLRYLQFLSGGFGYELAVLSDDFLGWGTFILILGSFLIFVVFFFNITQIDWLKSENVVEGPEDLLDEEEPVISSKIKSTVGSRTKPEPVVKDLEEEPGLFDEEEDEQEDDDEGQSWTIKDKEPEKKKASKEPTFNIEDIPLPEEPAEQPEAQKKFTVAAAAGEEKEVSEVQNLDPYDPTLDLASYQYPSIDLLNEYDQQKVTVSRQELEENKNKIVETLVNFKIGIQEIKATIGPTVTLYEIVPDPGVKISKIKNLEDDIALSLAALGIRIIAPIPGKGTIGIEVPNKNRELVAARSVLGTEKFMKSDKDLPVALGKTISNEVFVFDLAKMPHLLMAGATGQGKSVGLNVILASLVYKKHPSQLKFVLVDPKKVELTLFNKIERHFLAKLPNAEDAIITDTKKVIYTLNSLCIEMDNRYDLLKDAGCRNLKEYNAKFVARKLNPEKGHKFMPYIVLVIDELADLMMTAGKEIEAPIARLAQLARAIGIHLVVATQRPSVNVITGIIKANFPARLSFRVTSKVDSRTILDAGGAEQLIGMGDMLLSQGSEVIRIQCAFLDTPEVERVCEWIGEQRGYSDAYLLPEFEGEDGDSGVGEIDLSDRDPLFEDAARLIVMHQQGSTSLIQRKLKLGYNRAGRIIDQLEAAGVVGSFEGSKAREVLIHDEVSLEQLLNSL
ncbi:DNA translocase FtsK [Echinicola pacifica]|uniref:DNA translocase FtsK n=1 Tax=Echinicola pacifica TaxID=346377 RepID=A0A918Q0E8_9BACT|nr:DNA translocase FtsK [Echinicola pacifica]GGZ29594.1 DNA translocase FtsK [Echinicola pacifica]